VFESNPQVSDIISVNNSTHESAGEQYFTEHSWDIDNTKDRAGVINLSDLFDVTESQTTGTDRHCQFSQSVGTSCHLSSADQNGTTRMTTVNSKTFCSSPDID
jgi:hypothetical protein